MSFIGIVVGIFLLWKTYPLVNFLGKVDWAERYLAGGLGGTYFMYKLIGIIFVVLSVLYLFGILDHMLSPIASIFGGLKNN